MGLEKLELLLAIIGGVSMAISPFLLAWLTLRVHKAVPQAPAFIELAAKVEALHLWQNDHAEDVKLIPRLATILERVELAIEALTKEIGRSRE